MFVYFVAHSFSGVGFSVPAAVAVPHLNWQCFLSLTYEVIRTALLSVPSS